MRTLVKFVFAVTFFVLNLDHISDVRAENIAKVEGDTFAEVSRHTTAILHTPFVDNEMSIAFQEAANATTLMHMSLAILLNSFQHPEKLSELVRSAFNS